jgi:TolB-like protein/DNA-binding winged helix-turn-helix (wHTH) protein/Tfp pilus assembly protein PilF
MNEHDMRVYEFGPFSLDARRRQLSANGEIVELTPKALETLFVLVENRRRMLSKDELLRRVWNDTVVEEGGLTRNISVIRKALGEKPGDHRYILTAPGRGYQFIAEVREKPESNGEQMEAPQPEGTGQKRLFLVRGRQVPVLMLLLFLAGSAYILTGGSVDDRSKLAGVKSIAVLPMENLSGDPMQEYFADGMTEALIGSLARIRALRVVSRTSVMRYKQSSKTLAEIASDLDVDALVEGSVQQDKGRVKIMVQLIHAPTDAHLWAGDYESELADILKLQGQVAHAVAEEIRVQITPEEQVRMTSTRSVNPAAHEHYLLGRHFMWKYIVEDQQRAIQHFERAIEIDPEYAAAYAGLAHVWWTRGVFGPLTLKEVEPQVRDAVQKALQLDETLAEAHVGEAYLKGVFEWDWRSAEESIARALELNPNGTDARYIHAVLLMRLGRLSEALIEIEAAARLDPLSAQVHSTFGRILYRARKFEDAAFQLKRAIEIEPRNVAAYSRLVDVYEQMGKYSEALAIRNSTGAGFIGSIYARMGRTAEARKMLPFLNHHEAARVYAALGDKDEAFRCLFRMVEEREDWHIFIKSDPPFESLHSDPRWAELLRRMNIPVT